ncbi:hypothetical protein [Geoalkalibacter subterraneus]|uniref:hypothetical protein n=1 Tax=Geoalkalibacter subterraneus TaxID=483547 RepID=UPI00130E4180|nr:hypothetical protein [Geoalkalibacter subterraneus]
MPEQQSYIAKRNVSMADGSQVAQGQTVKLNPRQAKYLVLAGKIEPVKVEAKPRTSKEK